MTQPTRQTTPVLIAAIIGITILAAVAMSQGINGVLLTLCIGAICALTGTKIGKELEHKCIADGVYTKKVEK